MKYEITEQTKFGDTIYSQPASSKAQARRIAQNWKKENPTNLLFVSFFRVSDGQHGYLNPSGNHGCVGKSW